MARQAGSAEQRLIEAGKEILQESGFSGISVRAVAARAGVNLGLVSYHFGGKAAFVHRVALEIYEEFFRDFSLQVEGEADPLQALRKGLLRLALFVRDQRRLIRGLMRDLSNGNEDAKAFVTANFPRHGVIVAGLVRRCQADGRLVDLPLPVVMSTIMSVVAFPSLIAEAVAKIKFSGHGLPTKKQYERLLLSDEALAQRVELAIKAVKP